MGHEPQAADGADQAPREPAPEVAGGARDEYGLGHGSRAVARLGGLQSARESPEHGPASVLVDSTTRDSPNVQGIMEAFEVSDLDRQRTDAGKLYLEFLRLPAMSLGLYVLPPGGVDGQQPHTEDEVYYVISGRAVVQVGDEDRAVQPGSIIFAPPATPRRFHSITEELRLLVFFAPAEGTARAVGEERR